MKKSNKGLNKALIKAYEVDASRFKGKALEVVLPTNLAEVRAAVANSKRIVPRGGGTGLAGGAVPQKGEDVVLDLSKMNKIENLDAERMTVEVEAGVILDDLQNYLKEFRLEFPVNPSSHAVATIGGMIATDAVGSRAIKYGRTSTWVKWIEVVDGKGVVHKKGATELSDYAGMEGMTGVIVRACLKLSPLKARTASVLKVDRLENVVPIVKGLKGDQAVSMVEFLDRHISKGLGMSEKYHLIVEYEDNSGKLSGAEYERVLVMRDKIYPLLAGQGYTRIEDPKIIIDRFEKFMPWLEERQIPVFGHISVGIFHPCFNQEQEKMIPDLMRMVKNLGGQVSGEHGIGLIKKPFVEMNDKKILMNVKKRTDPSNKFNVGKVIDG
jgi:FAD/FMN-containing dehydrogenase